MGKIGALIKIIKIHFNRKEYKNSDFGSIGVGVIINPSSKLVPKNMFLGDNVIIQGNVNFISYKGKLFIKRYSVISSGCIIIPSRHFPSVGVPFYYTTKYHLGDEESSICIEEDCWIGAGSILLPGITIGRGSIVGAGSVVTKSTPPYSVVVGSPARIVSVKFSINDILSHELRLYSESERLPLERLENLFNSTYKGLPIIKKASITENEMLSINEKLILNE